MTPALAKKITADLDALAEEVEHHPELSPDKRLDLARQIDEVSDDLEKRMTMTSSRRKADVLQKDSDEKFMDTFDRSGLVTGQPYDTDEPYMKNFNEDKHSQVMNQAYKKPVPVRMSSVVLTLRKAARLLESAKPEFAAELRETARKLL